LAQLQHSKAQGGPIIPLAIDQQLKSHVQQVLVGPAAGGPARSLEAWQRLEARRGFWHAVP
jgi:hypothetical protein